jgi:hypothetical protein
MPGKRTNAKLPTNISHSFHRCYAAMRRRDLVLPLELPTLRGYAPGALRLIRDNEKHQHPTISATPEPPPTWLFPGYRAARR